MLWLRTPISPIKNGQYWVMMKPVVQNTWKTLWFYSSERTLCLHRYFWTWWFSEKVKKGSCRDGKARDGKIQSHIDGGMAAELCTQNISFLDGVWPGRDFVRTGFILSPVLLHLSDALILFWCSLIPCGIDWYSFWLLFLFIFILSFIKSSRLDTDIINYKNKHIWFQ